MPLVVTAAVVGGENATMMPGNETGQVGNQTANMSIAAYIEQDQNLTTLSEAIATVGLYDTLNSAGPYTVFAPNNDAFDALGNDTVAVLMAEPDNLTLLLQYHVVDGAYTVENLTSMAQNQTMNQTQNQTMNQTQNQTGGSILDIFSGFFGGDGGQQAGNMTTLQTLSGENLTVTVSNGTVMVENATIVQADINTTNGVIHIIDKVLVPPGLNLTTTGNQTGTMGNATTM
jgi:uncharacterized surface protein with fasciclin (FAS1) repeats